MATFSAASFRNAAPGLGALAQAIGGGSYEKARQGEIGFQSKLAQAIAQQQSDEATARLNTAKAVGTEDRNASARPEALRRNAMTSYGVPLDEEEAVSNFLQTGSLGGKYAVPADGIGPVLPAPDWQSKLGDVARAIGGVQTALTIGDKNSENIAKAGAINRDTRLSDAIIAGKLDRNTVGGAQAAAQAKPLFHSGENGTVLDQYTGNLNESGGLARSNIALKGAQANNQNAGAAAHYASAGKTNLETRLLRDAPKGRYEPNLGMLIDERTGIARPVVGPDGQPLGGKNGSGNVKLTEDQGKATGWLIQANNAWKNMQDAALGEPDAKGVRPIKSAARPGINDGLEKVWGMAPIANSMRTADRQKFMQSSSSLSEALLRAATGAGVNKEEAAQKVKELTPLFGEDEETTRQKFEAIPLYIEALKVRAGPGAKAAAGVVNTAPANAGGFKYLGKE